MDRPQEISIRVVAPHAMSEFKSATRRLYPRAQTDWARPRINVRVMHFRSAEIPVLKSFLDRLPLHDELDVPKNDDGRVCGGVCRVARYLLPDGATHDSLAACHRGQTIPTRSGRAGADSDCQYHVQH